MDAKEVPYQPIDKIITQHLKVEKLEKIVALCNSKTFYVDDTIKSYKPQKPEEKMASFDEKKAIKDPEEEKKEKYKNLSIEDLFKL